MTKTFEAFASGETLEIRVYGPIGGGMLFGGVTAEQVADAIKYNPGFKRIVLKINSPGGNAFEGMGIKSILASQDCETIAEVEGLAASAGSIAAMGCKSIRMHIGSAMMIHEARGGSGEPMDSKKLTQMASALETLNDGMASLYAKRTGKSKKKIREMMAEETWLTPEQAVKDGFADEVIDTDNAEAMKIAASFDLSQFGYQHIPKKFLADHSGTNEVPPPAPVKEPKRDDEEDEDTKRDTVPSLPPIREPSPLPPQQVSPPSAALTAEASAVRKRLDTMTVKLIAQAVGLQADADESAVVAAASQLYGFVAELKTLTKSPSPEAVLGAIRGLQAAAAQAETLVAQVKDQAKQLEAQERATLIAADKSDPEGRKLTPAMEAFWATQSLESFKGFLAAAPHIVQVQAVAGQQQPAAKVDVTSDSATSGIAALTHNGVAFENLEPQAKADLFNADKARYDELKRNHAERGSPRAQSQQQRASA
jgi:ATP-dependent protease ClpP protease subunit